MKHITPAPKTKRAHALTPNTKPKRPITRKLSTNYTVIEQELVSNPDRPISFHNLNSDQRSLLGDFVQFLLKECRYEGGALLPTGHETFQTLKDRFFIQWSVLLNRMGPAEVDDILNYIHLKRWDSTGELSHRYFVHKMYSEMVEKFRLVDAPEFDQVAGPEL